MTANNPSREIREWLRAEGHDVRDRGSVSARLTSLYYDAHPDERPPGSVTLLPGPDDDLPDDAYDDLGFIEPEPEPDRGGPADAPQGPRRYEAVPDDPGPVTADPGPAHAAREWRRAAKEAPPRGKAAPRRVTATVRGDISAKISLVLEVPGRVWQARDPLCGGVFVEQRPEIADALTQIVCGSPDLVAWFAGGGGQFMLWLNLMMACAPVVTVAMAHHVYRTAGEDQEDMTQPGYQQGYAA
jgi:hypothetical protein